MDDLRLSSDDYGRFHFIYSMDYPDVPLYLRVSEYLINRGARAHDIYLENLMALKKNRERRWSTSRECV